ncbi:MAG TPA: TIGR03620 family F420-dependent LLM class oxidoreductase, partial [Streptosporangiaceae bacterium]
MTEHVRDHLGRIGVWRSAGMVTPELAAGLEQFGYGTLWLGGSPRGDLKQAEQLLDATTRLNLATGIVNMWQDDAHTVAASFARIEVRHPGRFLLGVGAGHREATQEYARPYDTLARYVDTLLGDGVPAQSLVLAALGPKVLRLAAERTAGAHPYLVTPEYTRRARAILGTGPLLAPEQKAVLETDP